LLVRLNSYYPGKVYLFAHSLGNVAAGQALLMAGTNTLVNTYIAAQGAVAAHTYDPTTTNRTPTYPLVFTTPDRYAQYWTNGAPCYFNGVTGAGNYINFFNTNDWALTVAWEPNQDLKPDKTFSPYEEYAYSGSNFLHETTFPAIGTSIITGSQVLSFPTNTFTIYAYCDQAPCMALGAQIDVSLTSGVFDSTAQVELDKAPYNFTKLHVYHSGEFRSDNMQRWQFWDQVLNSYGLK
jgi:hypothetical protein